MEERKKRIARRLQLCGFGLVYTAVLGMLGWSIIVKYDDLSIVQMLAIILIASGALWLGSKMYQKNVQDKKHAVWNFFAITACSGALIACSFLCTQMTIIANVGIGMFLWGGLFSLIMAMICERVSIVIGLIIMLASGAVVWLLDLFAIDATKIMGATAILGFAVLLVSLIKKWRSN